MLYEVVRCPDGWLRALSDASKTTVGIPSLTAGISSPNGAKLKASGWAFDHVLFRRPVTLRAVDCGVPACAR